MDQRRFVCARAFSDRVPRPEEPGAPGALDV